jgi:hypothetical protein
MQQDGGNLSQRQKRLNDMATTVAGIHKEGRIELLAEPAGVHEGPVLVTLEQVPKLKPRPNLLPYGQYQEGRESTEEDFEIAEWRGEPEPGER